MQITLVTAKDGSDIQQCLEEAVKTMNIAKLKKIQVILTDKPAHYYFKQRNIVNSCKKKFSIYSTLC
jgi:predicted protein tyrosine phosphatase